MNFSDKYQEVRGLLLPLCETKVFVFEISLKRSLSPSIRNTTVGQSTTKNYRTVNLSDQDKLSLVFFQPTKNPNRQSIQRRENRFETL